MCLAVPVRVAAVADAEGLMVAVARPGQEPSAWQEASAALVAEGDDLAALVGRWVVVHTGYVMDVLDDADALSRLAMFAAIDGQAVDDARLRPPADPIG